MEGWLFFKVEIGVVVVVFGIVDISISVVEVDGGGFMGLRYPGSVGEIYRPWSSYLRGFVLRSTRLESGQSHSFGVVIKRSIRSCSLSGLIRQEPRFLSRSLVETIAWKLSLVIRGL